MSHALVIQPGLVARPGEVLQVEIPVPEWLQSVADGAYALETADICQARFQVVADGCADLLVDCRGHHPLHVSLSLSTPLESPLPGASCLLGVRLRPGVLGRLLSSWQGAVDGRLVALPMLTLGSSGLGYLGPGEPDQLLERLGERLLDALPQGDRQNLIDASLSALSRRPWASVEGLVQEWGGSDRHFRRLFRGQVGLSPKRYQRVRRFQEALQALRADPEGGLAELSAAYGYTDQSHMTRDWCRLSGCAPSVWRGRFLQDGGAPQAEDERGRPDLVSPP